jgi:hypothetical protein
MNMSTNTDSALQTKVISAKDAQISARLFNIGNILSMLPGLIVAPFAVLTEPGPAGMIFMFIAMVVPPILWFGISIIVYIIARYHPNPLVGEFTQQAAYRYYGTICIIIPVGTFFGTDWQSWIITGGVVGLVLVPWSIWELYKIQKIDWQDVEVAVEETKGEQA